MPYEGEYAHYQPLKRIVESERVKQLLGRSRILDRYSTQSSVIPQILPNVTTFLPSLILAIDGSNTEVDVKIGYPGARVGYCSVAAVIMNLSEIEHLDINRPVDPVLFRQTEYPSSEAAALPGCNIITRDHMAAKDSFREALFELFNDMVIDEEDNTRIIETFQALLELKPLGTISCPYSHLGCTCEVHIGKNIESCPCNLHKPLYPTDALRIHERFNDESGSNGEAFGYVRQVWERLLLIHLLRCFEKRNWIERLVNIAFFVDGPLAIFGPPAWLSASISKELQRINTKVRSVTGNDLMIVGIEKTGNFVEHFNEIDQCEDGSEHFPSQTYFVPTDKYIKQRIIYSTSRKRYGEDTYFGRKFFYKTLSGARIVANIPFLTLEQDILDSEDVSIYPRFGSICSLLDKLVTSRFENALAPLVSAHAQAAIPLHLGQKVLKQLAHALMQESIH